RGSATGIAIELQDDEHRSGITGLHARGRVLGTVPEGSAARQMIASEYDERLPVFRQDLILDHARERHVIGAERGPIGVRTDLGPIGGSVPRENANPLREG